MKTLDSGAEIMGEYGGDALDDKAYSEVQRLRARMQTWTDTACIGMLRERVKLMWKIHEDAFRKDFWDFTWLLEEGVRKGIKWSADYCAVDEINDLNALQATLMARLSGGRVEYVGDLDQAIYGFAGVDPQQILKILPHDEIETMELSHRLTAPIAKAAELCLSQASWRSDGRIKTEREGGIYHQKQVIEGVLAEFKARPDAWGDMRVIGRTNWIVEKVREMAREIGLNVANSGEEDLLKEFCDFIVKPRPVVHHSMIPALTASFLPAAEYYRRGAKAELLRLYEAEPDGQMSWMRFYAQYGTQRLEMALVGEWKQWYRGKIVDPSKPIITFDTFHASKGLEADTVVAITDITERVENEGVRDEEVRLAYVAITRARNHLIPAEVGYGWKSKWIPTSEPR